MLFDLRSRGRRRTVQVVYLGLAVLIGGGLILFGVGTGSGNGGLLNAFGGGSSSSQPAVSSAEKAALKQTQQNPNSASAWAALVQARFQSAGQDQNQTTGAFTSAGVKKLQETGQAWERYVKLTDKPDGTTALLAAHTFEYLNEPKEGVGAWQAAAASSPTAYEYYGCMAADAWAAGETDLGDLAEQKAISVAPKAQQLTLKTALKQFKTQPSSRTTSCT